MIFLKTDEEIELMREANRLVGMTLGEVAKLIKPGVTLFQLDKIIKKFRKSYEKEINKIPRFSNSFAIWA